MSPRSGTRRPAAGHPGWPVSAAGAWPAALGFGRSYSAATSLFGLGLEARLPPEGVKMSNLFPPFGETAPSPPLAATPWPGGYGADVETVDVVAARQTREPVRAIRIEPVARRLRGPRLTPAGGQSTHWLRAASAPRQAEILLVGTNPGRSLPLPEQVAHRPSARFTTGYPVPPPRHNGKMWPRDFP